MNKNLEWFDANIKPATGTIVIVKLDDETIIKGTFDENQNRKCWLIKGTGGLYWRSLVNDVIKWRYMTNEELAKP